MSASDEIHWERVIRRDAMDASRPRMARAGDRRIAIYLVDGAVHVTDNRCPHAAASLALGEFEGAVVSCPRHGWTFDVRSGTCVSNPGWEVRTYEVREVDGWIEVGVEPPSQPSEDELMGFITE